MPNILTHIAELQFPLDSAFRLFNGQLLVRNPMCAIGHTALEAVFFDRNCGCRRDCSAGNFLYFLLEKLCISIHNFGESKLVVLDISNTFDRVWHGALLS